MEDPNAQLLSPPELEPDVKPAANGVEAPKEGASNFATACNMLNELEGAGLLGLPYALMLGGWAALGCMFVAAVLAAFTGHALAECMYDAQGVRVRSTYPEVGRDAFGPATGKFVLVVKMCNLVAVSVVYLVLIGSTMHAIHPLVDDHWQSSWLSHADQRVWSLLAMAVVMPTVHVGGYKKVALMSVLGLVCLCAIVVVGIAYSAVEMTQHGAADMPKVDYKNVPAVFSMFLFAFSAHGIFPDLKASMTTPQHFGSVITGVFTVNVALKTVFTVTGYLAFGAATDPVLSANFSTIPRVVVSVLIALNTWLSFPLPLIPVFNTLATAMKSDDGVEAPLRDAAVRTTIVVFSGIVAAAVPNFAVAMGFMGSVTLSFLTFIFPAVFLLRLRWAQLSWATIVLAHVVTILGILGGVAGFVSTLSLAASDS